MGIINKDANLYSKDGKLIRLAGTYPKEGTPTKGNMGVMYVGMAKHRKNVKKARKVR